MKAWKEAAEEEGVAPHVARPRPEWDTNDLPGCSDTCPNNDGKRCEITGMRTGLYCEPTLCGMTRLLALSWRGRVSEPNIRAAYRAACPPIAGRILTGHEAAEADAMRAALASQLLAEAGGWAFESRVREPVSAAQCARRAAWATVLALLLAPEAA